MRVAVFGATGNIGTALIERLGVEDSVEEITGIARRRPAWAPPKTTWVQADITTDELVPHLRGADVVVHLAWAFQPTHDPLETWLVNVAGSQRVFRAAADAGVGAVVYASSVGAYSPGPKDLPVDESWPTDALPTAAYGREKSYVERVLDVLVAEHPELRVVRLRPAFVFQAGAAAEQWRIFASRLVPGSVVRRGFLPLVPRTEGLCFQVVHAADVAEAFRLAVVSDARGPFNIAAEPPIGAEELAALLGARPVAVPRWLLRALVAAAWHVRLIGASPELLDLALSLPVMDTSRAREQLGWRPRYSSSDAFHAFLDGLEGGAGRATAPLQPTSRGVTVDITEGDARQPHRTALPTRSAPEA
jgi:UDP-glucose 4-epimerase